MAEGNAHAVLLDLQENKEIKIFNEVKIALAKNGNKTTACDSDEEDVHFIVKWEKGGHILTPVKRPCLVDDVEVVEQVKLSHGSTILVANRYFRYIQKERPRRKLPPTPGVFVAPTPPRKPKSTAEQNEEQVTSMTEEVPYPPPDWCVITRPTLDDELLQQLQTSEQVANLAGSYVSRQVMLKTDTMLSSQDMDKLFRYLQEEAEDTPRLLFDFILDYHQKQKALPDSNMPNHTPVVWLLTELLKSSMDPVEHNIFWLRLLNTFSHFTQNLDSFSQFQTGAVVIGTMAAHSQERSIQEYGCYILSHLANYRPVPGQKVILKESGVELIVHAMKTFPNELPILRPGCRALANVTVMLSSIVNQLITAGEVNTVAQETITNHMSLLDVIQNTCEDIVKEAMAAHPEDAGVQTEGKRLLVYFEPTFDKGIPLLTKLCQGPRHESTAENGNKVVRNGTARDSDGGIQNGDNTQPRSAAQSYTSPDTKPEKSCMLENFVSQSQELTAYSSQLGIATNYTECTEEKRDDNNSCNKNSEDGLQVLEGQIPEVPACGGGEVGELPKGESTLIGLTVTSLQDIETSEKARNIGNEGFIDRNECVFCPGAEGGCVHMHNRTEVPKSASNTQNESVDDLPDGEALEDEQGVDEDKNIFETYTICVGRRQWGSIHPPDVDTLLAERSPSMQAESLLLEPDVIKELSEKAQISGTEVPDYRDISGSVHNPDVESLLSKRSPLATTEDPTFVPSGSDHEIKPGAKDKDVEVLSKKTWGNEGLSVSEFLQTASLEPPSLEHDLYSIQEEDETEEQKSEVDEVGEQHEYMCQVLGCRSQLLQYILSHWKRFKYLSAVDALTDPIDRLARTLKLPSNLATFLTSQPRETVVSTSVSVMDIISKNSFATRVKLRDRMLTVAEKLLQQDLTPDQCVAVCSGAVSAIGSGRPPDVSILKQLNATTKKFLKSTVDATAKSALQDLLKATEDFSV